MRQTLIAGPPVDDLTGKEISRGEDAQPAAQRRPWAVVTRILAPDSLVPTYTGIAMVLIGFVLIAIGWGRIAALTNVALQMPYLISAGFTGLGLIMCGLIVVNIAAKRRDAAERTRQLGQLTEVLRELHDVIGDGDGDR